jgi:hypothetical protein
LRLTKLIDKKIKLEKIKEQQFDVWLSKYLGLIPKGLGYAD